MVEKSKLVPYQRIRNIRSGNPGVFLDDGTATSMFHLRVSPDKIGVYPINEKGSFVCHPTTWKIENVEIWKEKEEDVQ